MSIFATPIFRDSSDGKVVVALWLRGLSYKIVPIPDVDRVAAQLRILARAAFIIPVVLVLVLPSEFSLQQHLATLIGAVILIQLLASIYVAWLTRRYESVSPLGRTLRPFFG